MTAKAPSNRRVPQRLGLPREARVTLTPTGRPHLIDGQEVVAVRETWLIEDRWWTPRPLRRRYWEAVTKSGRCVTVFRELEGGGWFRQGA